MPASSSTESSRSTRNRMRKRKRIQSTTAIISVSPMAVEPHMCIETPRRNDARSSARVENSEGDEAGGKEFSCVGSDLSELSPVFVAVDEQSLNGRGPQAYEVGGFRG